MRQRCTCDTRPPAEQSTQQQPPMSHTCSSSDRSGSGLPTSATSSICAQARARARTHTHTHTGACARADGLHFPASPDRTQAFSPSTPQPGRSGRPDGEDSSRENPVLYPTSPPPTFSPYHLLWPREAWGRGWLETKHSKDPGWQRRRVRGMGCACSLTQPALGTTAQLDRAATCRWAGESNERES